MPAGSMIIVTAVPAGGDSSGFICHSSISLLLLARFGMSISDSSKFTTLTTYPVTSAA